MPRGPDQPCGEGDWIEFMKAERDKLRQCMNAVLSNMIPQIEHEANRDPLTEPDPETITARDRAIHEQLHDVCEGMPLVPPDR